MSINKLWVEGTVIEFVGSAPCSRATIRKVGNSQIVVADIKDGTTHRVDACVLDEQRETGDVIILREKRDLGELVFTDISDAEQQVAIKRLRYVRALMEQNVKSVTQKSSSGILAEVAEERGESPPHWQSVRKWFESFLEEGERIKGLYPKSRYRGNRKARLPDKTVAIIEKASVRYFTDSKPRMSSVVANVHAKIDQYNISVNDDPKKVLKVPSYQTISRRVLNCTYKKKKKSRSGSRALDAELAGRDSQVVTTRVLERVEIDHTQLDIYLLHDDKKTLLGRPYITVLLDHYSEMLLGLQLSFVHPSFDALSIAMLNAFLPKDEYLNEIGCEGYWPAHGIPENIVADNGLEFWSRDFAIVGSECGFLEQFCPIRKPEYKGCVENFFNIVNFQVLDDLPGVVRKMEKGGDDYQARKNATMTFTEFKLYLLNWVTKQYHVKISATKGYSRLERWEESVEENLPIPEESQSDLWPKLMSTSTKVLSKSGINIYCKNYSSPALKDLQLRIGSIDVTVKSNPFDIGYILVLDEESKIYHQVFCTEYSDVSGMSKYEDRILRGLLKERHDNQKGDIGLRRARVEAMEAREEAHARNARNKNQCTTAKAARIDKTGVPDLQLVVDNESKVLAETDELESEELDTDGWSRE